MADDDKTLIIPEIIDDNEEDSQLFDQNQLIMSDHANLDNNGGKKVNLLKNVKFI